MLKEEDVVLCTVKRIEGTTIFLDIEGEGEGSMVLSEVAAGRIRNLREYVSPNKKIVCKVLKIAQNNVQLSFRRVTAKEREEVMDRFKKEKTLLSMLRTLTKNPEAIISKIKEKSDIPSFLEEAKTNPKVLNAYFNKEEAEKLLKILSERENAEKETRKIIKVKSDSESGIKDIQEILKTKEADIHYLGSSRFMIITKGNDFKEANTKLNNIVEQMQKKSKEKKMEFSIEENTK